jgi:hypothetical protein
MLLLLCSYSPPADAREKLDVVILKSGDRITCEVTSLSRGMLTAKTDSMGTVQIKWQDIKQITSKFIFLVQDTQGQLYVGSLEAVSDEGQVKIVGPQQSNLDSGYPGILWQPVAAIFRSRRSRVQLFQSQQPNPIQLFWRPGLQYRAL